MESLVTILNVAHDLVHDDALVNASSNVHVHDIVAMDVAHLSSSSSRLDDETVLVLMHYVERSRFSQQTLVSLPLPLIL
jgi:hypothetical protein